MQFPRSLHAEGLKTPPSRNADALSPPLHSRRFHAAAMLVAMVALGAAAGLDVVDDPRPLDVQLSTAMHDAAGTLRSWQDQLSRGLQVSLRAVADGRDATTPATRPDDDAIVARSSPTSVASSDRRAPVRADLAPHQKPTD